MKRKAFILIFILMAFAIVVILKPYAQYNYLTAFLDCRKGKFQKILLEQPIEVEIIEKEAGKRFGITVINLFRYNRLSNLTYNRNAIKDYNKIMYKMYVQKNGSSKMEEYHKYLDTRIKEKIFILK